MPEKKIGIRTKELWKNPEYREKMRLAHLGFNGTEKTRKILSENAKKNKLGLLNKGKKLTEEHKQKISKSHKGKMPKFIPNNKGVKRTNEYKEKCRKRMQGLFAGEKHPNWKGGISKNLYPSKFNPSLKLKIRTRDNFICCLCGRTEREELEELNRVLCVNHIDFDKDNCQENNLNTLCLRCNIKINRERDYWENYFKL